MMKLYEVMEKLYTKYGNAKCELVIETDEIAFKVGSEYEGKLIRCAGVNGRVIDIPAYLGGYDVIEISERYLPGNNELMLVVKI